MERGEDYDLERLLAELLMVNVLYKDKTNLHRDKPINASTWKVIINVLKFNTQKRSCGIIFTFNRHRYTTIQFVHALLGLQILSASIFI